LWPTGYREIPDEEVEDVFVTLENETGEPLPGQRAPDYAE
jgi:hypothetical protein